MIIFFKFHYYDLYSLYQMSKNLKDIDFALLKLLNDLKEALLATWRNGYAEDCKSFYPSSILGVASNKLVVFYFKKSMFVFIPR